MKEKTDELHTRYYKKFTHLESNKMLLTSDIYEEIAKNLLEEYRTEYKIMRLSDDIENGREIYSLTVRGNALIPKPRRRFLLFFHRKSNYAADLIDREMLHEITKFFERRERALQLLESALVAAEAADGGDAYDQPEPEQAGNVVEQESPQEPQERTEVQPSCSLKTSLKMSPKMRSSKVR